MQTGEEGGEGGPIGAHLFWDLIEAPRRQQSLLRLLR